MNKESFKEKSYWMTTREYAPGDPLQGDIDVDVAIVGGGFTGAIPTDRTSHQNQGSGFENGRPSLWILK